MNPELESRFDEFDKPLIIRRKLLPWWMKTFCWIFMILSIVAIGGLLSTPFFPNFHLSIYGFETNTPISGIGIFIIAIMIFKGYAAYSLWFEKENAINIGKIDAILGIVICVASMFFAPLASGPENNILPLRLEILLLVPYYWKLNKIEYTWDNLEEI
ncbi:hypothetical protein EV144_101884 [Flavobacterium sp. 270]|uniref:hypothetical protein n=1 Tax=Flavobacterium sp. 270 TaxID=2512114 RepID=UPI0010659E8E|nr:hypothetical protein [Flavobacterium sp. 270]TDW52196.1 hypothetical protein EV144_101884 [Flavobacterium sp. 270]